MIYWIYLLAPTPPACSFFFFFCVSVDQLNSIHAKIAADILNDCLSLTSSGLNTHGAPIGDGVWGLAGVSGSSSSEHSDQAEDRQMPLRIHLTVA